MKAILAVLLACASGARAASDGRSKGPVRAGPTVRTTPVVANPALNVNTGINPAWNFRSIPNMGTAANPIITPAVNPAAAQSPAASASRPAFDAARPGTDPAQPGAQDGEAVAEVDEPGKPQTLSGATQTSAKKGSELEGVRGVGSRIERARRVEAQDAGAATKAVLDGSFEARKIAPPAAAAGAFSGDGAAAVSGRGQGEVEKALSLAALASQSRNTPAASAPAIFSQAFKTIEDSVRTQPQAEAERRAAARRVEAMAFARAKEEIIGDETRPGLANAALEHAARGEDKQALAAKGSLEQWQALFGAQWRPLTGRTKPLVRDLETVTAKIDEVRAEAAKAGPAARVPIPRVRFTEQDGVLVHNLKPQPKVVAPLALSLAPSSIPSLRVAAREAEGLGRVYRDAGAAAAAGYAVSYGARGSWRALKRAVLAVLGHVVTTSAEVAGVTLRSRDFALRRLSAFGRAPSAAQLQAAAGARLVGLDLSRVVRPADAALSALSASDLTADGLARVLENVEALAAAHHDLTGEDDAAAVARSWKALLAHDPRAALRRKDALASWVERVRQDALDHVDRQMLAVLRYEGGGALLICDPASGQARLVAFPAPAGLSTRLPGFVIEESQTALRAYREGPGVAAALAAAAEALRGGPAPAEAKVLARAARELTADRSRARHAARRLAAEAPALSGFVPYAAVVMGGRGYLVERDARSVFVWRDAETLDLEYASAR